VGRVGFVRRDFVDGVGFVRRDFMDREGFVRRVWLFGRRTIVTAVTRRTIRKPPLDESVERPRNAPAAREFIAAEAFALGAFVKSQAVDGVLIDDRGSAATVLGLNRI
jgi:hypothetical protein